MDREAWWGTVHGAAKESDMTELLSLSLSGGGNGKAVHYSCLGNPRDRGAWWATVYGVAKSKT